MITEIVYFKLTPGITREGALDKYLTTAQKWSQNADLVRKYYFFDAEKSLGGGVYIWKDLASAHKWHGQEYRDMIKKLYGSEPDITCMETLVVVDNVAGTITEP